MKKPLLVLILCLILVLAINLYFRIFPVYFPQFLQLARQNIDQKIHESARFQVDSAYPSMSPYAKERAIRHLAASIKDKERTKYRLQVRKEYEKLKDPFQDASGQTYLMELDCWHWARYVGNVEAHGFPADTLRNKVQWDKYMLAPHGDKVIWNQFLFYFSSFLYKIFSLAIPVPLNTFLFYLPLLFVVFLLVVVYLFCALHFGPVAAVLSTLFIGLAPIFLPRSCAGWFDMDVLSLFFPFLITWIYLSAYNSGSTRQKALKVFFGSFFVGLFAFTWHHWWFIVVILMGYEGIALLHSLFAFLQYGRKDIQLLKTHALTASGFLLASLLWVFLFTGTGSFTDLFSQLKDAVHLNRPVLYSIWPNVFFTVQELGRSNLNLVASLIGDKLLFLFSLISMLALFLLTRIRKSSYFEKEFILIMVIWFFSMFIACFKGIRFIMFLIIPLGISFGWFLQYAIEYFEDKLRRAIVLLLCFVFVFSIVDRAFTTSRHLYPLINDNWYNLLIAIKEKTPARAVLNSWWDFGDWFKAIADRPVIFDGQSQNTPQAYWMAKILLENDEERAIAMLRMLNASGNRSFDLIDAHLHNPLASIILLEKVLFNPRGAQAELLRVMPEKEAAKVLGLVFGVPQEPAYFIVDPTMPDKIYAISFMGNWDFVKSYVVQKYGQKGSKRIAGDLIAMGVDRDKAQQYYQEVTIVPRHYLDDWISRRVRFYGSLVRGEVKDGIVLFENSAVFNPAKKTAYLFYNNGYKVPRSLFLFENGALQEHEFDNSELGFSVLIIKKDEGYFAIGLDRQLGKSLFVRLYFLQGQGLKHFKPFLAQNDAGGYIRVFKLEWN
ncbi:MAG: STT3 domain-containing protein [Candidatus Omnitrophica bacterium]|nr:STT3 domain-containing protein [Candidatus Omnitrophota bacterium]